MSTTPSVGEELLIEHQHVAQQLLGDIKLGALLGWGSFGRVYKGLWGGAQVSVLFCMHNEVYLCEYVQLVQANQRILRSCKSHPIVLETLSSIRDSLHLPTLCRLQ